MTHHRMDAAWEITAMTSIVLGWIAVFVFLPLALIAGPIWVAARYLIRT